MTNLGDYITQIRNEKGLSQRSLAEKAGFSHGTIQKIESGETIHPGVDVLVAVAKALKISPVKLLYAYQGKNPDDAPLSQEEFLTDLEALFQALKNVLEKRSRQGKSSPR